MNDNDNPNVGGPEAPPAILVVEDEFMLRALAANYLEEAGFPVIQAANEEGAIDQLKAHDEIGVVFTDVEMPPGMDGLDLARWISRERPNVKVLVASGKVPRTAVTDRPFLPSPTRCVRSNGCYARFEASALIAPLAVAMKAFALWLSASKMRQHRAVSTVVVPRWRRP